MRFERGDFIDKTPKVSYSSNISKLPLSPTILAQLEEDGITTVEQVGDWTAEDWMEYRGIGETRSEALVVMVKNLLQ
jgi:DNA-directed RNA polymerase alpha subunit